MNLTAPAWVHLERSSPCARQDGGIRVLNDTFVTSNSVFSLSARSTALVHLLGPVPSCFKTNLRVVRVAKI